MAQVNQHHKKTRMIAVASLVVGVLGLGVAFAALSTTLRISGTAKIKSASWDIHWYDETANTTDGAEQDGNDFVCTASGEAAVVSAGTNISTTTSDQDTFNVSAEFKTNGDQVVCTITAVNRGTLDAETNGVASSLGSLTNIGGVTGNTITSALVFADNSGGATANAAVADGVTLEAGDMHNMKLTLTYTGATVGTDTAAQNFTYTIPYVQKNI